jgi:hypothetical protein
VPPLQEWRQKIAAWTDTAPPSPAEVGRAVSELALKVPQTVADQLRRRLNFLGLATKDDVLRQSKLGRTRVAHELKDFLETQRAHDEALLASLRAEIHEELQSLAAALDDDAFINDDEPLLATENRRARHDELDAYDEDDLDDPDDEIDLTDDLTVFSRFDGD